MPLTTTIDASILTGVNEIENWKRCYRFGALLLLVHKWMTGVVEVGWCVWGKRGCFYKVWLGFSGGGRVPST